MLMLRFRATFTRAVISFIAMGEKNLFIWILIKTKFIYKAEEILTCQCAGVSEGSDLRIRESGEE